jgi:hypothetical protein
MMQNINTQWENNWEYNENRESFQDIQKETQDWILATFYKDEGVFEKVFAIITRKKINPSDLVNNLQNIRWEYKQNEQQ